MSSILCAMNESTSNLKNQSVKNHGGGEDYRHPLTAFWQTCGVIPWCLYQTGQGLQWPVLSGE